MMNGISVNVKFEELKELVEECYNLGVSGCEEMKGQLIENLIFEKEIVRRDNLKTYSAMELNLFPPGTIFIHSILGKGTIFKGTNFKYYI